MEDYPLPFDNWQAEPSEPKLPVAVRSSPKIWVEALAVYQAWPPSDETLLRRMDLRRGLNILWAQPSSGDDTASRLAGHGAGKTMFCRLIRYILDEANPGSLSFRKDFDEKFQHRTGWVLANVWLKDQCWLVGRPITARGGYQSFARLGDRINNDWPSSPPATGYMDYKTALEAAAFDGLALRRLSGSGRELVWDCAFQWLSRDQEAHYGGLLEWRHKESDSGSPELVFTDKENLVRILLGLVQSDEQELLRKHAKTSEKHEEGVRKRPKVEFLVKHQKDRLESLLKREVARPEDPVLQQDVANEITRLRKQGDDALSGAKDDPELDRLNEIVSKAQVAWEIASAFLGEMQGNLELEKGRVDALKKAATANEHTLSIRDLMPSRHYCSQPLNTDWRERCPLADKRADDDELDDALKGPITEAAKREKMVKQESERLSRQARIVAEQWKALEESKRVRDEFRKRRNTSIAELTKPRDVAADLDAAFNSYREACENLTALNAELVGLDREKSAIDNRLKNFSKHHEDIIELFSSLFNRIVQTLLGNQVIGYVEFSGKGIEPHLTYKGRRDSAALKLTMLLAFDLAALALGICSEDAHHPRLLIHDSPREADLAAGIYRSLFTAAHDLEIEFGGNEAPFQYIVTTTEPPPNNLASKPWVLEPVLDASEESKRFLKVNL